MGALPKYIARLDTTSNGFFLGRTEEDAEELVDNMVKSDAVYSEDHDRGSRTDDKQTRKELKALQDKIDILIADKSTQEQLNFVGNPNQETPPVIHEVEGLEGQEELCFINNNGSWYKKEPNFQHNNYQQKSYSNNQQSGYQPRNNQQGGYQPQQNPPPGFNNKGHNSPQQQANPSTFTPQESSTNALLKQILESQTRSEKHVGYELKSLHSKIDGSYNYLNNKFKALENQFAAMNTHQNRQQGSLPGKSEQNPKETMKAITLRSGKELPHRALTKDAEKQSEGVAINIDDEVVIVDEKINDEILEKIEKKARKAKSSEVRRLQRQIESDAGLARRGIQEAMDALPAEFQARLAKISASLGSLECIRSRDLALATIEDVVAAKKKEMEGMVILTHECSAIIQRLVVPKKLEDPGCFTLLCALGPMKLGFTQYKKCRLSLVLADCSVKYPVGILEDLPVMVGNYEIPTDFVVLEMGEEAQDPLILGMPFLATAEAIVNVKAGKIDL
ncbi:unnamed protein product, partial [Brassica oleracea]